MDNKQDIIINIKLVVDDLDNEQLAILHEVIHENNGEMYVYVPSQTSFLNCTS